MEKAPPLPYTRYFKKSRALKLLVGYLLFVILGWQMIIHPGHKMSSFAYAFWGILAIIIFGYAALICISALVRGKVLFTVNETGIFLGTNKNPIKWADISEIKVVRSVKNDWVAIFVKDVETYLGKLNFFSKMMANSTIGFVGTPFALSSSDANMDPVTLKAWFDEYLSRYKN